MQRTMSSSYVSRSRSRIISAPVGQVRADALETARSFLLGRGLVVPVLDELEALHALGEWQHRHPDLRLLGLVRDDIDKLGDRLLFGDLLRDPRHVVAREIAVHRLRRELALGDALDDRDRAHLTVATGEHPWAIGHERAVRHDRLALALADALLTLEEVEVRHLSDRRDDRVALNHEIRALDRHGAAPPGGIGLAERHALELDAPDPAVLLDDADRGREELKLDALVLGIVDLCVMGAHLLARTPVDH